MHYSIPGLDGYFGGKGSSGVHQQIINIIPPHEVLVVPFLGHCFITRKIKPAKRTVVYETDPRVYKAWLDYIPGSIPHYNYFETLEYLGKRQFEAHNTCGITFLENTNSAKFQKSTVQYLDPPYPIETRLSNHKYLFELSVNQHVRILNAVKNTTTPTIISSYKNDLYDTYLKGWNTLQFNSQTRSGKPAVETVYYNYDPPTELHDYSFFGNDYKEREHYKLKASRLVKKFDKMTPIERSYFSSILKSKGAIS